MIGSAIILILIVIAEVCSKKNGNGKNFKDINAKIETYNIAQKAVLKRLDTLTTSLETSHRG